jgi:biopolymer transport protein ExbD
MNGYDLDAIARRVIERAAQRTPATLAERLQEEWLADLSDHRGRMAQLRLALGCYWAAILIKHDCRATSTPAMTSPASGVAMAVIPHGMALFPRQAAASERNPAICEINTTPLIDVLLVLLITLIITLPIMTQAAKVDLPQSPSRDMAPPEVIDLDIDFDGAVFWNGSPVANLDQLEGYFRTESQKNPQPEIHLRPDPYVKYDVVAKILAAAQRNHLTKIGFVNDTEFAY